MERKAFIAVALFLPLLIIAASPQAMRDIASLAGGGQAKHSAAKSTSDASDEASDSATSAGELVLQGQQVAADGARTARFQDTAPTGSNAPAPTPAGARVLLYRNGTPLTADDVAAQKAAVAARKPACDAYATEVLVAPPTDEAQALVVERRLDQLYAQCQGTA